MFARPVNFPYYPCSCLRFAVYEREVYSAVFNTLLSFISLAENPTGKAPLEVLPRCLPVLLSLDHQSLFRCLGSNSLNGSHGDGCHMVSNMNDEYHISSIEGTD